MSALSVISISFFFGCSFRILCLPVFSPGILLRSCLHLGIGLLFSVYRSSL